MTNIYVAGSFNHFHEGHRALIQRAFDLSYSDQKRNVVIGIMSDEYLREKYPNAKPESLLPWKARRDRIQKEMGHHPQYKTIMSIDYFPAHTWDTDILVVSEETVARAAKLVVANNPMVKLSIVPMVLDEEGYEIHSRDWLSPEERE